MSGRVGGSPALRPGGSSARKCPSCIGQALVRHLEADLQARGCPKFNLQVLDTHPAAFQFWQQLGYEVDAVRNLGSRLG